MALVSSMKLKEKKYSLTSTYMDNLLLSHNALVSNANKKFKNK